MTAQYADEAFSARGQLLAKGKSDIRYSRGLGLYCARAAARLAGAEVSRCDPIAPATNAFQLTAPCR